ncbi:MAG: hypothetical protein ACK5NU_03920 [Fusobacterium ulcerans]|uniref:hypothetical protein n=1 Tax=Fusobacterium ulcerans TaxID=861 RepID=UPI003A895949
MKELFKKSFIVLIYVICFLVGHALFKYAAYIQSEKLFLFASSFFELSDVVVGIIIFIVWQLDKRFKFLYYLAFIFVGNFINFISAKISSHFNGRLELILLILFAGIVLMQLSYNFLRGLSYKKYPEL